MIPPSPSRSTGVETPIAAPHLPHCRQPYLNDQRNDFANYYDEKTFQAFEGLSNKPWLQGEEGGLSQVLEEKAEAVWEMIQQPKTHLYLAGLTKSREEFYKAMAKAAGSQARLRFTREEMMEQGRWSELTYG